jgi:hypothetical protein
MRITQFSICGLGQQVKERGASCVIESGIFSKAQKTKKLEKRSTLKWTVLEEEWYTCRTFRFRQVAGWTPPRIAEKGIY